MRLGELTAHFATATLSASAAFPGEAVRMCFDERLVGLAAALVTDGPHSARAGVAASAQRR